MISLFHGSMQLLRCPLSVRLRSGEQVPSLTVQVARASNPGGTTAMWVKDRLNGLWRDEDFLDWYPRDGRPGLSPAQLATVCVLQFLLDLSDRQAAEAVRCRIDFKYALAMELDDAGSITGRLVQLFPLPTTLMLSRPLDRVDRHEPNIQ